MYINRQPLGRGNLTFGKHKRRYPAILVILYVLILAAALFVAWRMEDIQPYVLAMIGPEPTPTPSVEQLTTQGEQAYYDGEMEQAVDLYRQAVAITPEDHLLWARLSFLLTLNRQYEEAVTAADQAIALAPESVEGYAMRARALNWMGAYDDSAIAALRAIDIDPNYALGHAFLAEAYTDLGRLRQAREQAEMALQLDPYEVEARRNYAYVLEFYGDYNGAIQQYLQALRLAPNRLDLWYGLARNYRGAGMTDQAINTFVQIAIRTPEDPLPYVELGKTYFEVRDDDAAQEYLEQAVSLVCDDCPRHTYEEIEAGQLDPARLPEEIYVPAWRRLGMVYLTRRNYESSIEIFEELIAWGKLHDPDAIPLEAYYVTATAYYYRDKCDLAVPHALEALDIYEREQINDPNALRNILSIFVLCRDYAIKPYVHTAAGFENGFPIGYEEPDVIIERPGTDETG
ncbi:MAG: hypothetical protein Kow00124_10500 [Anaerolineae bacterium]